ncbi:FeoC-like transcriptional regulator [Pseudomonas aeruginosa]
MATLMQLRAALEDGQARGLKQLSRQVDAPPALVEAILERLIALGKVERVAAQSSGGCGGGCKGCAQRDPCAAPER